MKRFPICSACGFTILIVTLSLLPISAHAALWGTDASAELTGVRTSLSSGGIDATDGWNEGGFTISWSVTEDAGRWSYAYTVTAEPRDISHFILEVTNDSQPFDILPGTDADIDEGSPRIYSSADSSNPLMPNPIYGVKFDFGGSQVNYTIVTNRAPVYGVFYAKDGKNSEDCVVAWSNALNFADYQTNDTLSSTDFIARPNSAIPIPGAVWLLGSGLIGLVGIRRQFKR